MTEMLIFGDHTLIPSYVFTNGTVDEINPRRALRHSTQATVFDSYVTILVYVVSVDHTMSK